MTESPVPDRLVAALAASYRVERQLGEGGMATVYLADDLKHQRKVAIKVLRPELAAVVGAERFLSEIRTTANLQHPHILPLFDSGEADGFLFYVMPFVEGETLRDRLTREKQLPVDDAVAITRKVASALDYAHRHGVIHRDIKPANILLQDGEPQLADFGIALAVQTAGGGRLTETGLSLGTPFYMSPEQATGDRDPDPRSDLYSLGCVAFEMLAGDPPFTGSTAQSVLAKILTDDAPLVTRVRKTVPLNVASAVAKATQRLPADRFASVGEFADAMGDGGYRYGELVDTEGAGSSTGRRAGAASTGASPGWRLAAGVLAVAVVGLGALLVTGDSSSDGAGDPLILRMVLPDSQALAYPVDGMSVSLSDDGSTLVYAGPGEAGIPRLWVKRAEERLPTPIQGTDGVSVFDVSPDGEEVVFLATGSRVLNAIPTAGGTPREIGTGAQSRGLHWGTDGYIYFQNLEAGISRLRVADGSSEEIVPKITSADTGGDLTWPWLLPGGRDLLVTKWGFTGAGDSAMVVNMESGARTMLVGANTAQFMPPSHLLAARTDGTMQVWDYDVSSGTLTGTGRTIAGDVRSLGSAAVDFYAGADGTLLYVAGAENTSTPVWVDREGASRPVLQGWEGSFTDVTLSRDGRRVALAQEANGRTDLWVVEPDGNAPPQRITFDGDGINRPAWDASGDTVLYLAGMGSETARAILAVQWAGIGSPTIRYAPEEVGTEAILNEVAVSDDGRYVLIRTGAGDITRDIQAMDLENGGTLIEVAASPASETAPTLSPGGRFVAYVSNESGRDEVYIRTFPDVSGGKWIVSAEGGGDPVWSRDGTSLFYRDARSQMVQVVWDTERGGVLSRTVLFDARRFAPSQFHASYGVHPDGRFLMLESVTDDQLGLMWMSNFPSMMRDGS